MRRAECERAARLLGAAQLRDLQAQDVSRIMSLPEPLGRRARHVVTEDDRVLAAVTALRAGDVEALGEVVPRLARIDARRLRGVDPRD